MLARNSAGLARRQPARPGRVDENSRPSKLPNGPPQAPAPRRRVGDVTAELLREIFRERAGARAILVEACVYTLHEAVDVLQADAERTGLVDAIGTDSVQVLIAEAFSRPQCVYRLLIGPVELAAWLAEQSAAERKAIKENLEATP
jgi:hypothetical protein